MAGRSHRDELSQDRVLTIVYDATVDTVPRRDRRGALNNSVNIFANQVDAISGIPPTVPDPSYFDVSGDPAEADVVVPSRSSCSRSTCSTVGDRVDIEEPSPRKNSPMRSR